MAKRLMILETNVLMSDESIKAIQDSFPEECDIDVVVLSANLKPLVYADDNTTINFTRGDNNG